MFNSWYISLAVTHGARCFGDDELLRFIGMAAILANDPREIEIKNGVSHLGRSSRIPILSTFLASFFFLFYTTREKYKDIFHSYVMRGSIDRNKWRSIWLIFG